MDGRGAAGKREGVVYHVGGAGKEIEGRGTLSGIARLSPAGAHCGRTPTGKTPASAVGGEKMKKCAAAATVGEGQALKAAGANSAVQKDPTQRPAARQHCPPRQAGRRERKERRRDLRHDGQSVDCGGKQVETVALIQEAPAPTMKWARFNRGAGASKARRSARGWGGH
jgi:hypothetical protein